MWGRDGKGLEGKGWRAQSCERCGQSSLALSFHVHFCQWGQTHFPRRAVGALSETGKEGAGERGFMILQFMNLTYSFHAQRCIYQVPTLQESGWEQRGPHWEGSHSVEPFPAYTVAW